MSKIEDYKFEALVVEMRGQGKSLRAIADKLNSKIPETDEPISEMAVSRWLKANKDIQYLPIVDEPSTPMNIGERGLEKSEDINPYEEIVRLVTDCDLQIELLKRRVEPIKKGLPLTNMDIQNLTKLHEYIARKQALLADIAKYQKDMASFSNVREMMKLVYDSLQEVSPEAYEKFKLKVAEKQSIKNILK